MINITNVINHVYDKKISNESMLYDYDKLYFLVTIPTYICYYCLYVYLHSTHIIIL